MTPQANRVANLCCGHVACQREVGALVASALWAAADDLRRGDLGLDREEQADVLDARAAALSERTS